MAENRRAVFEEILEVFASTTEDLYVAKEETISLFERVKMLLMRENDERVRLELFHMLHRLSDNLEEFLNLQGKLEILQITIVLRMNQVAHDADSLDGSGEDDEEDL